MGSHGSSALAHHFHSISQQRTAHSLGMWLFMAQEIMFFGGLFTAYVVYRALNPLDFAIASSELNSTLGGINTVAPRDDAFAVLSSQLATAK